MSSAKSILKQLSDDIGEQFDVEIRRKLEEGANLAEEMASKTCSLWGEKVNSTGYSI